MKFKLWIIILFCFSVINIFAQIKMPDEMANSPLALRAGISELDNKTVSDIFLNKKFKQTKQLDGTIVQSKYGITTLNGNTYTLEIDIFQGDNKTASMTFTLVYQNTYTLL